jgi:hypothetical protein
VEEAFLKVARELNGKVNTGVIQLEDSKTKEEKKSGGCCG